jgi:putative tryptophan/tyrosine transport system substrate-binding protein
MSGMGRRDFIRTIGGAAAASLALPLTAGAQQPPAATPVVGYLSAGSAGERVRQQVAFRRGLEQTGFVEGRNLRIEYRWAEGRTERLQEMAADLVRREVNVIFATGGSRPALAAKRATRTIPIVFSGGGDPVQLGLVSAINRPGGNMTGTTNLGPILEAKRLALFHELTPRAAITDILINPVAAAASFMRTEIESAAATLGRQVRIAHVNNEGEIESAFTTRKPRADALFFTTDPLFLTDRDQLIALAARHAIPASYFFSEFCVAGGLMSYGADNLDLLRSGGTYVGRILKGEKPADLPVMMASKFEFVINLKTAKALGLTVPDALLARADEVIE